jgi:hypothetical protein
MVLVTIIQVQGENVLMVEGINENLHPEPSQESHPSTEIQEAIRGTGGPAIRRGRGGKHSTRKMMKPNSTQLTKSIPASQTTSDTAGATRRSGRVTKPSRIIVEKQEIQQEIADSKTEQQARRTRRLTEHDLISEFIRKHGA